MCREDAHGEYVKGQHIAREVCHPDISELFPGFDFAPLELYHHRQNTRGIPTGNTVCQGAACRAQSLRGGPRFLFCFCVRHFIGYTPPLQRKKRGYARGVCQRATCRAQSLPGGPRFLIMYTSLWRVYPTITEEEKGDTHGENVKGHRVAHKVREAAPGFCFFFASVPLEGIRIPYHYRGREGGYARGECQRAACRAQSPRGGRGCARRCP